MRYRFAVLDSGPGRSIDHVRATGLDVDLLRADQLPARLDAPIDLWLFQDSFEHLPDPSTFVAWMTENSASNGEILMVLPRAQAVRLTRAGSRVIELELRVNDQHQFLRPPLLAPDSLWRQPDYLATLPLGRLVTPEEIAHGRTGFVSDDDDAVAVALSHIDRLDRAACREHVVERVSVERMAAGYEAVYRGLLRERGLSRWTTSSAFTIATTSSPPPASPTTVLES